MSIRGRLVARLGGSSLPPITKDFIMNEDLMINLILDHPVTTDLIHYAQSVAEECVRICEEGEATQMTSMGAAQKIRETFGLIDE